MMVFTFWLLTGTIGFYATYYFIRKIYGAVKIDWSLDPRNLDKSRKIRMKKIKIGSLFLYKNGRISEFLKQVILQF